MRFVRVHSHKGPFARQPRKVEAQELSLEVVVQGDELAVAAGAQVAAGHVDVEDLSKTSSSYGQLLDNNVVTYDISLPVVVQVPVVGHRDGQGSLLSVVDASVAAGVVI